MPQNTYSPFSSFVHFLSLASQGKVSFPSRLKGTRIRLDDGEWLVLREMIISPKSNTPGPEAVFRPRFHIKGMSPRQNEWFSWLPIPFFAGLPGFRRKLWLLDPVSGDFSGYYEWQTESNANAYAHSFAMRFMTARSIPGSVSARILGLSAMLR